MPNPDFTKDAQERATTCRFGDPLCPCQDGDACHYEPLDESGIGGSPHNVPPEYALNAIRQAEQAAREKALEEAALVAEIHSPDPLIKDYDMGYACGREAAAYEIRALKDQK